MPEQLGSSSTSWGVQEVAHVWLRGASCPRMCASASGPLAGLRCVFLHLGTASVAPLSLWELGRVRVGQAWGFYSPIWWHYTGWRWLQVSTAVLLSGNAC